MVRPHCPPIPLGVPIDQWTPLRPDPDRPYRTICRCACGKVRSLQNVSLRGRKTKSCNGCANRKSSKPKPKFACASCPKMTTKIHDGLCCACFLRLEKKKLAKPCAVCGRLRRIKAGGRCDDCKREPTAEEVEAMVAEQMRRVQRRSQAHVRCLRCSDVCDDRSRKTDGTAMKMPRDIRERLKGLGKEFRKHRKRLGLSKTAFPGMTSGEVRGVEIGRLSVSDLKFREATMKVFDNPGFASAREKIRRDMPDRLVLPAPPIASECPCCGADCDMWVRLSGLKFTDQEERISFVTRFHP